MKIEMGESLFYSWLRHVKECQIVQTNWKPSSQWSMQDELAEKLMRISDDYFNQKYDYRIYKENRTLSRLLQQAECDVLGLSFSEGTIKAYAIDVAFHEMGLNYGDHQETVERVIKKCLRTAMCLNVYLQVSDAEIIFASPKIRIKEYDVLQRCVDDMNELISDCGLPYRVRLIANEEFDERVLQPILMASENVADTSELFLRSYQLYGMFANQKKQSQKCGVKRINKGEQIAINVEEPARIAEQKVGMIARKLLRRMLEEGAADAEEIINMQSREYSKRIFHLNYPLLLKEEPNVDTVRYYAKPLLIEGVYYYLCSEWFETAANNDRPYLLKWIEEHGGFA